MMANRNSLLKSLARTSSSMLEDYPDLSNLELAQVDSKKLAEDIPDVIEILGEKKEIKSLSSKNKKDYVNNQLEDKKDETENKDSKNKDETEKKDSKNKVKTEKKDSKNKDETEKKDSKNKD